MRKIDALQIVHTVLQRVYLKTANKVKVKVALAQVTKAQRGSEVYLYSFFNLGARLGGW
jgi:hypothetical protein